jgi:Flp pilus assembly protein TadB
LGLGSRKAIRVSSSTNHLLFAIVVLLFALVLKLVSSGIDIVVFVIAFAGLAFSWYAVIRKEPH